jgi:hypothetical protein
MQGLGGGRGEPRDVNPLEDVARREAKDASKEKVQAQREREKESPSCRWMGGDGARGGHPPRSGSSGEGEEVRRIALPPSSSPRITLPLLRDMVCQQVGTTVNERVLKRPQIGTEPPTDSLGWLHLTQVTSDHEERDELSSHVNGTCNTLCY